MSNYPERPQNGKRPPKPGQAPPRPSSERSSKKARTFIQAPSAPTSSGPRPKEATFDGSKHTHHQGANGFLAKYRNNYIPQHHTGKKGRS